MVLFGGVHAPQVDRPTLLDGLIDEAQRGHRRVMAVQLRADQVPLFAERGFAGSTDSEAATGSGSSTLLTGDVKMKLRNKIRRARSTRGST